MSITIYHNPRCSKSRQTLALLNEAGAKPEIIEYLQTPPTAATLQDLLAALNMSPDDIMRTGEAEYKAARDAVTSMSAAEKVAWLCANPKVIQRPIVVTAKGVRIGRPPECVHEIL